MNLGRIIRSIIIICLSAILGFILTSCGKSEKTEKEDRDRYKLMTTIAKPNQEAVALLSLKYDLQPSTVERFLDCYLTDTDMGYKLFKDSLKVSSGEASKPGAIELLGLEKESYSQALAKASQSVGITITTAALLVLDYKVFRAKGNGGD